MAEIVVGPVIDKLIDLLIEEGKLFKGVHKEVKTLTDELESIKCFLKDAESRSGKGDVKDGVKIWVKQVRDEANHIEDVIDEYLRHVAPRRHESGFVGFLQKIHRSVKQIKARHHIASEVRDIKTSLREIKERSERYDFRLSSEEGPSGKCTTAAEQYDPRLDSIFIEEDDVVGIDSKRDGLISMLVDGASTRTVISLVGTGGVGKTTLASKVYENEVVKTHFNCRCWITVSRSYDLKKKLKNMATQLFIDEEGPGDKTDEIEGLIKSLREHLNTQRYMVVFDDVWDIEFWEVIKHAFLKNDKGSRVIITTRNDFIGDSACQETSCDIVHKLQPLSEEVAWELFCKKAFQSKKSLSSSCPMELEELSRKIVSKCQGLPLVITAMARLLSTKEKIVSEWQNVLENMSTEFESNRQLTSTLKILSLSYDDLPHHLKSCFLYFGIFPEDYSISDARLYRLWIAEGFVKLKDKRPEDIAEEYLEELIHRNLVQVSYLECQAYDRMLKVHDMLREIILLKMVELGFCQILNAKNSRFQRRYRRLSIHGGVKNVQEIVEDSGVRSVFIFNVDELMQSFVVTLVKKFKLLRLLEFRDVPLDSLPKEVGDLFHLKYLGLKNTKVKMLPKSIGKLEKLQTLDLANTLVRELPFEINNLRSLRHFAIWHLPKGLSNNFYSVCGVKIPQGIGCLEDLQSLSKVEAHHEGRHGTINELLKLRQLRALSITKLTTETGKALCGSIEKMTYLQRLRLSLISEDEILDLQSISSPPRLLRFLSLRGPLPHLPHWISSLQELWELRLTSSKLHDEPLGLLHGLPNLQRLFLDRAYGGEELHFEEGGFQKLKGLSLKNLAELKVLKIDQGALPCLEMLDIGASQLKEVPSGIQHLSNLKTLRFHSMPIEFFHAMNPDGGQDYYKVMHVSSVTFWEEQDEGFRVMKLRKSDSTDFCCAQHFSILQKEKMAMIRRQRFK